MVQDWYNKQISQFMLTKPEVGKNNKTTTLRFIVHRKIKSSRI